MSFNVFLALIIAAFFFMLFRIVNRQPNVPKTSPNTLIKRREERTIPEDKKRGILDVAKAHEHEKKLKETVKLDVPENFHELKLIDSITKSEEEKLQASLETIRKPHPLLQHLTKNISDPKKLYEVIRTDPELVAKIINVSNSPLFGLSKPITNVNHAVIYLGVMQVKSIATHFALQESVEFVSKSQSDAYQRIWSAGYLASSIAQLISKELGIENSAELSTRCQLGYLGDICVLFAKPETAPLYLGGVSIVERIETTQKIMGANTALLGKLLAKRWNLPERLSETLCTGLLPLTNQLNCRALSELEVQEALLCYLCCRMADIFSFDQDLSLLKSQTLSYEATGRIEFFHTPTLIESANFDVFNKVFSNPGVKSKIASLLDTLNTEQFNR